jgi:hypothetical protein
MEEKGEGRRWEETRLRRALVEERKSDEVVELK